MTTAADFPLWMTTRDAQAYIPCKTLKATYEWLRRHHIVRRSNGSIARTDLDRALNVKRRRRETRGRHPNSRANLRRRTVLDIPEASL